MKNYLVETPWDIGIRRRFNWNSQLFLMQMGELVFISGRLEITSCEKNPIKLS